MQNDPRRQMKRERQVDFWCDDGKFFRTSLGRLPAQPPSHFLRRWATLELPKEAIQTGDTHAARASTVGCRSGISESVLFSQEPSYFRFAIDW